jgi:ATP-dependent Lon protease
MGHMRPDRIPLFPLNVVLFPGASLPLHIFELRYRRMVRECLESKSEFGMLLALPNGTAGTGCSAEILEVTRRYRDGRSDILTIGRNVFRVVEFFAEDPLLGGAVDYLEDLPSTLEPSLQRRLVELYEICHTLIFSDYPREISPESGPNLSYLIADKLPLDLLWKQCILELRSESARQERLVAYLREWAPHLQKVEALHQAAGGNGRGLN